MSVIWDLLNDVNRANENSRVEVSRDDTERRRSPRASVYVPVFVYGYTTADEPFHQETNTLQVNANGALLKLSANVVHGQKLLVTNRVTQEEQECYVVTLMKRPRHADLCVGVAFANSAPGFWGER
jgi:hypothetical protein